MENTTSTPVSQFGALFNAVVAQNRNTNVITSPLSVYAALAMVAEGASGNTFKELKEAFGYNKESDVLGTTMSAALVALHGTKSTKGITIKMSNALYTCPNCELKQTYITAVKSKHHAFAETVDFTRKETEDLINKRISDATEGLIKDTVKGLDGSTVAVLVNTIYFKGLWDEPFKKENTIPGDFTLSDGSKTKVTFMHNSKMKSYIEQTAKSHFCSLPYVGEQYVLVIEMPNDGQLVKSDFTKVIKVAQSYPSKCSITIPKFKAEFKCQLKQILENLGVRGIFTASKDLHKLADSPVFVSSVIHQAFIQVDEEGTTAAAVTVAVLSRSAAISPSFVANKPFFFHIVDKKAGLVLFSGALEKPSF